MKKFDNQLSNTQEDFRNYLQGWTDMLEQERQRFINEDIGEDIEEEILIENIDHPAVNAKQNSLFKELVLPF